MRDEWVVRDAEGFGQAIAYYRERDALAQAEVADLAVIHRSYLSNLERGEATLQTERLFRVVRRLGLGVAVRPWGLLEVGEPGP